MVKRIFLTLILTMLLVLPAWGVGTVTDELTHNAKNFKSIVFTWTADASDGSVPAYTSTTRIDGYIDKVITNPGGTATRSHTCDATCATNEEFALTAHPFTTGSGGDVIQSSVTECGMTANTDYYACPATTGATANFFKLDDTDDTCASILNLTACTLTGVLAALAPTDNYDITLINSDGVDVVHGQLANRDAIDPEEIVPVPADNVTVYGGSAVVGKITPTITNNSVKSATGTVTVIFSREGS